MIKDILDDAEDKMQKSIEYLAKDLSTLRAGRANPAMLEKITVDYYGEPTPINQIGNITVPEARLLVIQPWDKSIIAEIEKAIFRSDLGITPSNDGVVIRIAIPQLTEDRRKELVKMVKKKGEETKVAIRNIRRESNDLLKVSEKDKLISEDENKKGMDEIQNLTDKWVKNVDQVLQAKEKDIMEV